MERIACFLKVSKERFTGDIMGAGAFSEEEAAAMYGRLTLPVRGTAGSAGYDLCTPFAIDLAPGECVMIPTGIRVRMQPGWVMLIVPRSGLGSRNLFRLTNGTGVIDSDYFASDNEGHIFVRMINESPEGKRLTLAAGKAFAQCIFVPFGITEDDAVTAERNGGFGSTG